MAEAFALLQQDNAPNLSVSVWSWTDRNRTARVHVSKPECAATQFPRGKETIRFRLRIVAAMLPRGTTESAVEVRANLSGIGSNLTIQECFWLLAGCSCDTCAIYSQHSQSAVSAALSRQDRLATQWTPKPAFQAYYGHGWSTSVPAWMQVQLSVTQNPP